MQAVWLLLALAVSFGLSISHGGAHSNECPPGYSAGGPSDTSC